MHCTQYAVCVLCALSYSSMLWVWVYCSVCFFGVQWITLTSSHLLVNLARKRVLLYVYAAEHLLHCVRKRLSSYATRKTTPHPYAPTPASSWQWRTLCSSLANPTQVHVLVQQQKSCNCADAVQDPLSTLYTVRAHCTSLSASAGTNSSINSSVRSDIQYHDDRPRFCVRNNLHCAGSTYVGTYVHLPPLLLCEGGWGGAEEAGAEQCQTGDQERTGGNNSCYFQTIFRVETIRAANKAHYTGKSINDM